MLLPEISKSLEVTKISYLNGEYKGTEAVEIEIYYIHPVSGKRCRYHGTMSKDDFYRPELRNKYLTIGLDRSVKILERL